jgi:hypothetical protein
MTKISNQYSLTNILTADLANSRLGINNVSPAYSLDLTGTARVSTSAYFATASGSVGIGTESPSDKLNIVVGANGNVARFDGPTSGLIFQTNASTTDIISYGGSTPAYRALNFSTGASTNLTITTAGNVGIGTTSPTGKFAVNTGASNQIAFFNNSSSGGLYNIISLNGSYSEGTNMSIQGGATGDANLYVNSGYTSSTSGAIIFRSGGASVYTERMRITSAGDVGIGTSSPGYKLQVSGTGYFSGNLSSGGGISASGTLSSAALSTSQVLYAVNLTTFNYAGTLALTVPNALNSGSTLAEIRMYMIWATGFGDASHAGARIWLMIMNGNGTAYSATELLGRDTDGGTGLSISRSAVNQITISSNGYGFIKSVSCMQLITN